MYLQQNLSVTLNLCMVMRIKWQCDSFPVPPQSLDSLILQVTTEHFFYIVFLYHVLGLSVFVPSLF